MRDIIRLAEKIATQYHEGQYRKSLNGDRLPYIVHPKAVARLLLDFGITDDKAIAVAWLHDVLEDTPISYDTIKGLFGQEVADGVYILTRNVDNDEYKKRLTTASFAVKMIKLCDTLDNIETLECLSLSGIERKVHDCRGFYIPLAKQLCPAAAEKMEHYIDSYLERAAK